MTETPNLLLPMIQPDQALKHVTHNEALMGLDVLCQIKLLQLDAETPPEEPNEGDAYALGGTPTGDWEDEGNKIAFYTAGGWRFMSPNAGWLAWNIDDQTLYIFDGTDWTALFGLINALSNLTQLGIGASADSYNRLLAKTPSTLLSAEYPGDGGSGDTRVTLNKATTGNVASINLQNNWSNRLEMGVLGDDDFTIKSSPDGSTWHTLIKGRVADGKCELPNGVKGHVPGIAQKISILPDSGRFAAEKTGAVSSFVAPSYLKTENSSVLAAYQKFHYDSSTYGGGGTALHADVEELATLLRESWAARYHPEFWVAKCTAGDDGYYENTQSGGAKYRQLAYDALFGVHQSASLYVYAKSGSWLLSASECNVRVDGTAISDYAVLTSADGWVHVNTQFTAAPRTAKHQFVDLLPFYANDGNELLFALPAIFNDCIEIDPFEGLVPSIFAAG